jgi:hypothetical protein
MKVPEVFARMNAEQVHETAVWKRKSEPKGPIIARDVTGSAQERAYLNTRYQLISDTLSEERKNAQLGPHWLLRFTHPSFVESA